MKTSDLVSVVEKTYSRKVLYVLTGDTRVTVPYGDTSKVTGAITLNPWAKRQKM